MKILFKTPLRTSTTLTIIVAILIVPTMGLYSVFLSGILIVTAMILFLIDYGLNRLKSNQLRKKIQWVLTIAYASYIFVSYMEMQEHNDIIFPENFSGQAGIIFGIEGYPELPQTFFWEKTISIPDSGILITSTKSSDIPNSVRFKWDNHENIPHDKINWDANYSYSTILSYQIIRGWLFNIGNENDHKVQEKAVELANDILSFKLISSYRTHYQPIVKTDSGDYLHLQDQKLTGLPDQVAKLKIYKAILTGNDLMTIPEPILKINGLEDLYMSHNKLAEIDGKIIQLQNLRLLAINGNTIKKLPNFLATMPKLEVIYIGTGQIDSLEIERFSKLFPHINLLQD